MDNRLLLSFARLRQGEDAEKKKKRRGRSCTLGLHADCLVPDGRPAQPVLSRKFYSERPPEIALEKIKTEKIRKTSDSFQLAKT